MKVERIDDDGNRFNVVSGGHVQYFAEREVIRGKDGQTKRGHWLLYFKVDGLGFGFDWIIVDRDQYSNDLIERIECGLYEPVSLKKFKLQLDKTEWHDVRSTVIADAESFFGGEWVTDYHEWEGMAVFMRKFEG